VRQRPQVTGLLQQLADLLVVADVPPPVQAEFVDDRLPESLFKLTRKFLNK
jgi:hypothetical protein